MLFVSESYGQRCVLVVHHKINNVVYFLDVSISIKLLEALLMYFGVVGVLLTHYLINSCFGHICCGCFCLLIYIFFVLLYLYQDGLHFFQDYW